MMEQIKVKHMFVKTLSSGEKVIVDPALTTQRLFLYFYFCINIGSITGQVAMVYAERYVGFWLSFLLPTIMFLACPIVLQIFHKKYTHRPPTGSVLGNSMKLLKFASKGKVSANPVTT
jgi:POT family proton-dependent oligopeptide transporter